MLNLKKRKRFVPLQKKDKIWSSAKKRKDLFLRKTREDLFLCKKFRSHLRVFKSLSSTLRAPRTCKEHVLKLPRTFHVHSFFNRKCRDPELQRNIFNIKRKRKQLCQKQRSIALVAGAPTCPCLPGAQRLPQQTPPPGSKNDMKRAALLRQGNPHGLEGLNWNENTPHLTACNSTKRSVRE